MPVSRRRFLGLVACAPVVPLVACAPDPVVTGGPTAPFSPTPTAPVQSQSAERSATWIAAQIALVGMAGAHREAWAVPAGTMAWVEGAIACGEAQLSRLLAADPLVGGTEPVFTVATPSVETPADLQAFDAALDAGIGDGVALFTSLARAAETQPDRLLYSSLAISAEGARSRAVAPVQTDAAPVRFTDSTPDASLAVALTHVWALLQGLEMAAGRLPDGVEADRAKSRLPGARDLRDRLRDAFTGEVPGQAAYYEMPNAMTTAAEVTTGIAILETNLLHALARVVSSDHDITTWWADMMSEVAQVQSWGGALPFWPGWADVA